MSSSVFSEVFIAEEVDGVGEKGSGDTTMVDIQTLLEAFLNMSLKYACFSKAFFLIKSNTSGLQTTLLKCQVIRQRNKQMLSSVFIYR
jgi:hypothetical protein